MWLNRDQLCVVLVEVESINVNYAALRIPLAHLTISILGRRTTISLRQMLSIATVARGRISCRPLFFSQNFGFAGEGGGDHVGDGVSGDECALFLDRFASFLRSEIVWKNCGNHCFRIPMLHYFLGNASQYLKYSVRCIENVNVFQNFTSIHDFHNSNKDMIINRSIWKSVVVQSMPVTFLRVSGNFRSPYESCFLAHIDVKI